MTTKLDGLLKREVTVGKDVYTLTLSPDGLVLAPKGRRKGVTLSWRDLVSGDAALATALNASLAVLPLKAATKQDQPERAPEAKPKTKKVSG